MMMNTQKENLIKSLIDSNIKETEAIYDLIELYELTNEQYVLDWLDKLNFISIK